MHFSLGLAVLAGFHAAHFMLEQGCPTPALFLEGYGPAEFSSNPDQTPVKSSKVFRIT